MKSEKGPITSSNLVYKKSTSYIYIYTRKIAFINEIKF
jgi:hypothetical protein